MTNEVIKDSTNEGETRMKGAIQALENDLELNPYRTSQPRVD